jgi:K+-sensing histidine kinase KdpD
MELIIHELLQNSKKFHPSQTPQVQIRVEALSAAQIQIQFLDDGQAMTAEQITWAKQPYSQGEKFFTGEMPGMGLGLSAVTTLVWQSGGQVRITNRTDRVGICVSLILAVLKECGASKGE